MVYFIIEVHVYIYYMAKKSLKDAFDISGNFCINCSGRSCSVKEDRSQG